MFCAFFEIIVKMDNAESFVRRFNRFDSYLRETSSFKFTHCLYSRDRRFRALIYVFLFEFVYDVLSHVAFL